MKDLFLGIDVGTGGVRAMAVTGDGQIAATASVPLDAAVPAAEPGRHEQSPEAWWQAVCRATGRLMADLERSGFESRQLAALAVDGTSGTVVAQGRAGEPLCPAIMYNDSRAAAEGQQLNALAGDFCRKLGYQFNASFALAKILWLRNHEPDVFDRTERFVHQADFVVGRLVGSTEVSDYSNALKTGYDLVDERWPVWLDQLSGLTERLPRVEGPGAHVGQVSEAAARDTGLPVGLAVVAGATDGTAAFLASGARRVGDYNTTLGTTLVFKGISRQICQHPQGLIYCHKLPGDLWLPGAASNTGCQWIEALFPDADPQAMDRAATARLPNACVAWPLVGTGERFPLLSKTARAFFCPEQTDACDRYAACLQGTALVERLCYQVLDATVSGEKERAGADDERSDAGGEVYSTGGGSRSDVWMQCRADVTGRPIHRPACGESAFGSAVLAAAGAYDGSVTEAAGRMVRTQRTFVPDRRRRQAYDALFSRFCDELHERGYW